MNKLLFFALSWWLHVLWTWHALLALFMPDDWFEASAVMYHAKIHGRGRSYDVSRRFTYLAELSNYDIIKLRWWTWAWTLLWTWQSNTTIRLDDSLLVLSERSTIPFPKC